MKAGDINVSVHVAAQAGGGRLDVEGKKLVAKGWPGNRVKVDSSALETPLSQDLHLGSHLELRIWGDIKEAGKQGAEFRNQG